MVDELTIGLESLSSNNLTFGNLQMENIAKNDTGKYVFSNYGIEPEIQEWFGVPEVPPEVDKSDVYSLGIIIGLITMDKNIFLNLLFTPIKEILIFREKIFKDFPWLKMIGNMVLLDFQKRPSIKSIRSYDWNTVKKIEKICFEQNTLLFDKKTNFEEHPDFSKNVEMAADLLVKALEQLFENVKELKTNYEIEQLPNRLRNGLVESLQKSIPRHISSFRGIINSVIYLNFNSVVHVFK